MATTMRTKKRTSKKQATSDPVTQIQQPRIASDGGSQQTTNDPAATSGLADVPEPGITPPWRNRRDSALCPLCNTEHQHVLAYLARHRRKPTTAPAEIAWLRQHAEAAGLVAE